MKKFNREDHMHTKTYTEAEVQIIVDLVCEELEIAPCAIYPLSSIEAKFALENGIDLLGLYCGFEGGCYRIELKDEANLRVALHEVAHHYQNLRTAYADGTHTPHDGTFTTGCKSVTKAMKKIFKEWEPNSSFLR